VGPRCRMCHRRRRPPVPASRAPGNPLGGPSSVAACWGASNRGRRAARAIAATARPPSRRASPPTAVQVPPARPPPPGSRAGEDPGLRPHRRRTRPWSPVRPRRRPLETGAETPFAPASHRAVAGRGRRDADVLQTDLRAVHRAEPVDRWIGRRPLVALPRSVSSCTTTLVAPSASAACGAPVTTVASSRPHFPRVAA
jgi:hypothetical protein